MCFSKLPPLPSSPHLSPAESKRTQITELLESIEERLGELEEEKEELREYQKWDKMHRSIEYTIHEKELRETRSKIDALTDQHDHASHKSRDLHKKVIEAQAKTEVCGCVFLGTVNRTLVPCLQLGYAATHCVPVAWGLSYCGEVLQYASHLVHYWVSVTKIRNGKFVSSRMCWNSYCST